MRPVAVAPPRLRLVGTVRVAHALAAGPEARGARRLLVGEEHAVALVRALGEPGSGRTAVEPPEDLGLLVAGERARFQAVVEAVGSEQAVELQRHARRAGS